MNKEEAWNKERMFCAERTVNGKKGEEEIRRIKECLTIKCKEVIRDK
jgi:hypothetical protein